MRRSGWDRVGAAAGLVFVALFIGGFFGLDPPNRPEVGTTTAEEIRRFIEVNSSQLFWYATLPMLGWVAFVWFLARLRATLAPSEVHSWLSSVAFGAGLVTAGLFLGFHGFQSELASQEFSGIDEATVFSRWTVIDSSFALFGATTFLRGSLMAATSLVAITTGALPKWLGWAGLVAAAVNFVDGFDVLARMDLALLDFSLFLVWVAVTSVVLTVRRDQEAFGTRSFPPAN